MKVQYTAAYIVGALCVLGLIISSWLMLMQTRRTVNSGQTFRQGSPLIFGGSSNQQKACLFELMSAFADGYVMIAISMEVLDEHTSQGTSVILQYAPTFFRPALLQFTRTTFLFEFYLSSFLPFVVLLAFAAGASRNKALTLSGVQCLANNKHLRVLFDAISIGVVKKLVGSTLCEFSNSKTRPHLIMADYIPCEERRQTTMALVGCLGIVIWYLWMAVLVRRKSFASAPVCNLYDFVALTVLWQAKVCFGVASAAFAKNEAKSLLIIVFFLTLALTLLGPLTGGGPCRFPLVNRLRLIGTLLANGCSVAVLLYWLSAMDGWNLRQLSYVVMCATCMWSVALGLSMRCRRKPVIAVKYIDEEAGHLAVDAAISIP